MFIKLLLDVRQIKESAIINKMLLYEKFNIHFTVNLFITVKKLMVNVQKLRNGINMQSAKFYLKAKFGSFRIDG